MLSVLLTPKVSRLKVCLKLAEAALREALVGVTALGVRSKTEITSELISAASDLTVIGAFCIGTDKSTCWPVVRRVFRYLNAPYSNTRSVAELALGHMLALLRFIPTGIMRCTGRLEKNILGIDGTARQNTGDHWVWKYWRTVECSCRKFGYECGLFRYDRKTAPG